MKKNIIFFISDLTRGGAGNSIFKLVKKLNKKKNFKVSLVSLKKNDYIKDLKNNNINYQIINKKKIIFSIKSLIKVFNTLFTKNYKNIIVSNIHYNNIIISVLRKFLKPFKLILVERTPIEELDIYFNIIDLFKKKILKLLLILYYPKSDIIVSNSKGISKTLSKLVKKKIKVIYPPTITKNLRQKTTNFNNISMFCLSRLSEEKNIILILKAINILKNKINNKLNIYGEGPQKKNLEKFVKKNKIDHLVSFHGFIKDMSKIKDQIHISSSLFEGCSNSTIEAINYSKIVICSNCPGGNNEILLGGRGGVIYESNDDSSLAKAIMKVLKNPQYYLKKTIYNKKKINRFNENLNFKNYTRLFNSI